MREYFTANYSSQNEQLINLSIPFQRLYVLIPYANTFFVKFCTYDKYYCIDRCCCYDMLDDGDLMH